jgi:hypothetical protein
MKSGTKTTTKSCESWNHKWITYETKTKIVKTCKICGAKNEKQKLGKERGV